MFSASAVDHTQQWSGQQSPPALAAALLPGLGDCHLPSANRFGCRQGGSAMPGRQSQCTISAACSRRQTVAVRVCGGAGVDYLRPEYHRYGLEKSALRQFIGANQDLVPGFPIKDGVSVLEAVLPSFWSTRPERALHRAEPHADPEAHHEGTPLGRVECCCYLGDVRDRDPLPPHPSFHRSHLSLLISSQPLKLHLEGSTPS
jgi:hypothetical protein